MRHLTEAEKGTMNRRQHRTLGLTILPVGAIAFMPAAQPGHDQKPPKLDIAGVAEILDVTKAEPIAALGLSEGGPQ